MLLTFSMTVCINWLPMDVTHDNTPQVFVIKQDVADPGH